MAVLSWLHQLMQMLHLDMLRNQITWMMGIPAGMKLNEDLSKRLGSMILYGIDVWDVLTTMFIPLEPYILTVVSCFGLLGASFIFAVSSDLLSVMTVHLDLVHTAFSRLYAIMLTALSALWRLFRGKKKNVLRQRIDSCDYDMDQLVVGTLLFTLIFFLFPTITVYYLFFTFIRLLLTMMQVSHGHIPFPDVRPFRQCSFATLLYRRYYGLHWHS
jgi:phosphatidylinositol glycan class Q protein